MRRVLVLRPEPGASATVERARALGLNAIALPLFEVAAVDWQAPEPSGFDGLLLTSANAIRHGGDGLHKLRGLPVYAVGEATGEAAREAGFDIASTGDAGVERLLGSIDPELRLLHLAGEDRREAPDARQQIRVIPVYRSRARDSVKLEGLAGSVALIHSARAGRRFAELGAEGNVERGTIAVAAFGSEAADAVGDGWEVVETAESPSDDALLALAKGLCNTPGPR